MLRFNFVLFLTCVLFQFSLGCSPYVISPPARMLSMQTAKTLNKGETAVQVEGGGGGGGEFGFAGATARVRRGFTGKLDGFLEGNYLRLTEDVIVGHENIYSAGVGVKYAFVPHFALAGTLSGGGWEGGGFISPELKAIASYENPYLVPFVDFGGFTSSPISPNEVAVRAQRVFVDDPDLFIAAPNFTYGLTTGGGLRIPISHDADGKTKSGFILGVRYTMAAHEEAEGTERRSYLGGSAGFELVIP